MILLVVGLKLPPKWCFVDVDAAAVVGVFHSDAENSMETGIGRLRCDVEVLVSDFFPLIFE